MKRMFDFACVNGHKTERLTDYESISFRCECGETANRILSAPNFKFFPIIAWEVREKTPRSIEVGAKAKLINSNVELILLQPKTAGKGKIC